MILPPFSPGTALRIEYTAIGGRAFLRTVPERLPGA